MKSFTKTIKKLKEIKVLYSDILDLKEKILSVDDDRAKAAVMAAIDFKTKSGIHYTTYSKDGDKYLSNAVIKGWITEDQRQEIIAAKKKK